MALGAPLMPRWVRWGRWVGPSSTRETVISLSLRSVAVAQRDSFRVPGEDTHLAHLTHLCSTIRPNVDAVMRETDL